MNLFALDAKKRLQIFSLAFLLVTFVARDLQADDNPLKPNPIDQYSHAPSPLRTDPLLHALFPYHEKDEAYEAQENGNLSKEALETLMNGSSDDYFRDMDYGITRPENQDKLKEFLSTYIPGITKEEATQRVARGRNNWIVWTGGNDRFWNFMTGATLGNLDFLKTISSHPSMAYGRKDRWEKLGLVNEPCFEQAQGPQADRWGLWLDKRNGNCAPDPYADEKKYPGIKIGSRGKELQFVENGKQTKRVLEVGSFYGYPTGIIGLRLFPNPDFDTIAASRWDAKKYYEDPNYYNDPQLIRPYRVGMTCAFCHVGPSPTRPPADFNNPKWENLNSNAGAQYYWVDRIFVWNYTQKQDNFVYQLLHTARPGTLDTSLISSDQINNPRTMNAVYDLPARVAIAMKMNHTEALSGPELQNMQFNRLSPALVPEKSVLRGLSNQGSMITTARILKDGSDSVGVLGALNRVSVNIGLFGEEWVQNFIPVIGGSKITPFRIAAAENRSLYWKANTNQTPDLALMFLAASRKDKLADAPGGAKMMKPFESDQLKLGKKVFADNCAACHSSKLPEQAFTYFNREANGRRYPGACVGSNYLTCWNDYWKYVQTDTFKKPMEEMVQDPKFLENNFLSTDLRVPINIVDTMLCSPIATNAIKDNIWDNFSSSSYKSLPSVGQFTVNHPGATDISQMVSESIKVPDGGRGFFRPPSLISVWATAPLLQNNALGSFDERGTVDGRMKSFEDSVKKLLNPELRTENPRPGEQIVKYKTSAGFELTGFIDVTTKDSYLKIPQGYLPNWLFKKLTGVALKVKAKDYMVAGLPYPDYRKLAIEQGLLKAPEKNASSAKKSRTVASYENEDVADYSAIEAGNIFQIGPIPKGVPVNLVSNIDLSTSKINIGRALYGMYVALEKIKSQKLTGDAARDIFMKEAAPGLLRVSKCTDFVVNRGHYFGTKFSPGAKGGPGLSSEEKTALIEFMKHF